MNAFDYVESYLNAVSKKLRKNLILKLLATFLILQLSLTAISVSMCVSFDFVAIIRTIYFSLSALLIIFAVTYSLLINRKILKNPVYLADFLEKRIDLGYRLKTYVELKDFRKGGKQNFSEALFAANTASIAKILGGSNLTKVVEQKTAVKLLAVLLSMVVTIITLSFVFPGGFSQGVRNLFYLQDENFLFIQSYPIKVRDLVYDSRIEIIPPSYIGNAGSNIVVGITDITILAGSTVRITGKTRKDVTGGSLVFMDNKGIKNYLLDSLKDNRVDVSFSPSDPGRYTFRLQKASGITLEEELWHYIDVKSDLPPEIRIIPPVKNILKAGEEIKMELSVVDDYGLGAIDIVFSPEGGEATSEERKRIFEFSGEKSFTGHVIFRMPEMDALDSGTGSLWFEAFDNDPTPRKKAKSQVLSFILDTPEIRISKEIESLTKIMNELTARLNTELTGEKLEEEKGVDIAKLLADAESILNDLNSHVPKPSGRSVFPELKTAFETSKTPEKKEEKSLTTALEEAVLTLDEIIRVARLELLKRRWNEFLSLKKRLDIQIKETSSDYPKVGISAKIDKLLKRLSSIEKESEALAPWIPYGRFFAKKPSLYSTTASQIEHSLLLIKEMFMAGKNREIEPLMDSLNANIQTISDILAGEWQGHQAPFSPEERAKIMEFIEKFNSILDTQREILEVVAEYSFRYTKILNETVKPEIEKGIPPILVRIDKILEKFESALKLNLARSDIDEISRLSVYLENMVELLNVGNIDISLKLIGKIHESARFLRDEFEEISKFPEDDEAAEYGKALTLIEKALSLTHETAMELKKILPETDKFYSEEEIKELSRLSAIQKGVASRMEKNIAELKKFLGDYLETEKDLTNALSSALADMNESVRFLKALKPKGAEESERRAIQEILKAKRGLEKLLEKPGFMVIAVKSDLDWVEIPEKQQALRQEDLRHELMKLKDKPIHGYEDLVKRYYEEISQ